MVSGNCGLLQTTPTYDIWNVSTAVSHELILKSLDDDIFPFLDMLLEPRLLRSAILDNEAPLFDPITSMEFLLLEFGAADARTFLNKLMETGELDQAKYENAYQMIRTVKEACFLPGEPIHNLAVIALTHRLHRRWLA
jgi:hypothetical protein